MSNSKRVEVTYGPRCAEISTFIAPAFDTSGAVEFVWNPNLSLESKNDDAHLISKLDIEIIQLDDNLITEEGLQAMISASTRMVDRIQSEGYFPEFV